MEATDVALLTHDEDLADVVGSAAAAAGATVARVRAPGEARGLLLVGADAAEACARTGAPPGASVVLVGEDIEALVPWSMALRARVLPLPDGLPWLTAMMAEPAGGGLGRIIGVCGASGGVGTSTVAVALAQAWAQNGQDVAAVEVDARGGGLDLLLGAEATPGWRWPALLHASGSVGDLRGQLPRVEGVDVVSHARDGLAPGAEAVRAVVTSLARTHDAVVLDAGHGDAEALALCDRVVVVAGGRLGSLAAGARLVAQRRSSWRGPAGVVVVAGPVAAGEAAKAVGLPLLGTLPRDPALARAAEEGVAPLRAAGRGWRTSTRRIAEALS